MPQRNAEPLLQLFIDYGFTVSERTATPLYGTRRDGRALIEVNAEPDADGMVLIRPATRKAQTVLSSGYQEQLKRKNVDVVLATSDGLLALGSVRNAKLRTDPSGRVVGHLGRPQTPDMLKGLSRRVRWLPPSGLAPALPVSASERPALHSIFKTRLRDPNPDWAHPEQLAGEFNLALEDVKAELARVRHAALAARERDLVEAIDALNALGDKADNTSRGHVSSSATEPDTEGALARAAERFALVERRPDQAAFRKAVFIACNGRCVLTGCDVSQALEAAHLRGRNWRMGHNKKSDGVLLRRDVHALYDAEMLYFDENGYVRLVNPETLTHYGHLEGRLANVTKEPWD